MSVDLTIKMSIDRNLVRVFFAQFSQCAANIFGKTFVKVTVLLNELLKS